MPRACERKQLGNGFALAAVLVVLVTTWALASAALAAALGQLRVASAERELLHAQAGARSILARAFIETSRAPYTPLGESSTLLVSSLAGAAGSVSARGIALSPEFYLFVGEARLESGRAWQEARLSWWMDPAARVSAHMGVVESPGLVRHPGAKVLEDPTANRRWPPACDAIRAISARPNWAQETHFPTPQPPEWGSETNDANYAALRLGWFGARELSRRATAKLANSSYRPSCPSCAGEFVLGSGLVTIDRSGRGVVFVDGSIRVRSQVSWRGMLVATGPIRLGESAEVTGLLRSDKTVTLMDSAVVAGSWCMAARELGAVANLRQPIPFPGRSIAGPISLRN